VAETKPGSATASILKVKEWMGHVDGATTMRYLHFAPQAAGAALVAEAFEQRAAFPGVDTVAA
jgi:hypothetical protein